MTESFWGVESRTVRLSFSRDKQFWVKNAVLGKE